MLFHRETGVIQGISEGCYYEFGISPDITEGTGKDLSMVLKLSNIFPDLGDPEQVSKLSSSALKTVTHLDTTKLPSLFYVDKNDLKKLGRPRLGKDAF